MRIIKFIKYWIRFNIDPENEPSLLFTICFIISFPVIMVYLFYRMSIPYFEERDKERKEFWNGWNQHK